ncbi:5-formyltetrahydrofolate cyclo-ligase [Sphingomonas hengshuiensis]|uniref:5-formyltetrahydrofolate cyclo-ligase n=1 Tax=Sphingomonas hengshuiensis TaxID=1609977 RepID=A0A7U4J7W9_9SPHN|nr:5-formyltetrahydrofolate cyclo-ligase [Sphingomonas hengshuiensis]AJP71891.1 5-formyltetrahydrofolate cyclo-ligase [Sphingomonas hengshuiensis]
MTQEKHALRARLRADRDKFAAEASAAICAPDALLAKFHPGRVVTSYMPVGSEADPSLLAAAALERGCRIALPHVVDRATPMRFLAWQPGDVLVAGAFGLLQPDAAMPDCIPDIILTPLLGFDRRLNRIGQGAGFYDRAFARFENALRIGVAWSVQEAPAIPADIWDVPLHAVITERGMICHEEP